MAELASGAVSSLLGVIRNELTLLGRVRGDVQFIQEEMESMHSFLEHLARTVPPHGEHDPQVRTWMSQVRLLAQDCNNCIDLYLYRGNPDIHLARAGLRRYLLWVPWFVNKMIAQHRAAEQLRELKERARDIGERRLRYSVDVPAKKATEVGQKSPTVRPPTSTSAPAGGAADDDREYDAVGGGNDHQQEMEMEMETEMEMAGSGSTLFVTPNLDEYFRSKLVEWMDKVQQGKTGAKAGSVPSIGIRTRDTDKNALALAHDALAVAATQSYFKSTVLVDIPALHLSDQTVKTWDVLYYILWNLKRTKLGEAKEEEQQQDPHPGPGDWRAERSRKWEIKEKKWQLILEIYIHHVERMVMGDKIENILKGEIQQSKGKGLDLEPMWMNNELEKEALGVFLVWLQLNSSSDADAEQDQGRKKAKHELALRLYKDIIPITAKKLGEALAHAHKDETPPTGAAAGVDEALGGQANKDETPSAATGVDEAQGGHANKDETHPTGAAAGVDEALGGHANKDETPPTSAAAGVDEALEEHANKDETPPTGAAAGMDLNKQIHLDQAQYEQILRHVFPITSTSSDDSKTPDAAAFTAVATSEDQVKEIVEKVKLELVRGLLQTSRGLQTQEQVRSLPLAKQDTTTTRTNEGIPSEKLQQLQERRSDKTTQAQGILISEADIKETVDKMDQIRRAIEEHLIITGIADKIKGDHITKGEKTLLILKIDQDYDFQWEDIRDAISLLLGCVAGVVIVTASMNTQQAKKYCYPAQQESLDFSYAGQYHDAVLRVTRQQMLQDNKYSPRILREILDNCDSYEFCMKIFIHALYAKPKRTHEELRKLVSTLQQNSEKSLATIAKKLLKFSYNDLPKEYMTCLLYLAIFPPGYKIRRSTLIGRWVAEGLITTEDWCWDSSVQEAERCFDALVHRWLIYPAAVGATGKVKSFIVGEQVHEFITKIAQKQRMVETRLSHHLARHVSVFNNLRLRASDTIQVFFQKLPELSQYTQLKVLDLEGSQSFDGTNKRDLNNICRKILLLKYLSLRKTNVTRLPRDINNLHELEVLDIRQTKVSETRNVRLLKLKRFLAGSIDTNPSSAAGDVIVPSSGSTDISMSVKAKQFFISAQVPEKIEKMVDMEVLSTIEPHNSQDLKDIGSLWKLRKLGVVIKKDSDLHDLFEAISNLNECIRSLSITLHSFKCENPRRRKDLQLKSPPKHLESLMISGATQKEKLVYWLAKDRAQLTKVTLSNTSLSQDDMEALSELPKLRCLRLRQTKYTKSKLIFEDGQFKKLKYFLVEGSSMTGINFDNGTTAELEKIVLSLNDNLELCGLEKLQELKELELYNNDNTNATTTATTVATAPYTPGTSEHSTSPSATTTPTSPTVGTKTTTTNENTDATGATTNTLDTTTTTNPVATEQATSPNTDAPTINTDTAAAPVTATAKKLFSLLDRAEQITKVTLHGTLLKKVDIQILASKGNIRSLVLLDKSYDESQLTLKKDEFPNLNILIVDCSKITKIEFTDGSSPRLDKIIWTFTKMDSLSGINNLPRLKELEFKGDFVLDDVKKAIGKHINRPYFTHYKPENQDQVPGNSLQKYGLPRSQFFLNKKSWCWRN